MSQLIAAEFTSFSLILLLIFSSSMVLPVWAPTVVGPYDWVKVGAYVKYTIPPLTLPAVTLPNGSLREYNEIHSSLFQWTIVDKQGSMVQLNLTLYISGSGWYYDPELGDGKRFTMTYHKTVFVDVDIYSREGFVDGEPIGKTCFWADPYAEEGDKVILSTDPDFLEGEVRWVMIDEFIPGKDVKMYRVPGQNCDPNAHVGLNANYIFSWYTGVCWQITILGPPYEIPTYLIGNIISHYENGTSYSVLRCAGTKLGEHIGLAPAINNKFWGDFNGTNIDMALETSPGQPPQSEPNPEPELNQTESSGTQLDTSEPLDLPGFSQYLPVICIVIFVVSALVIIVQRRRHGQKRKHALRALVRQI